MLRKLIQRSQLDARNAFVVDSAKPTSLIKKNKKQKLKAGPACTPVMRGVTEVEDWGAGLSEDVTLAEWIFRRLKSSWPTTPPCLGLLGCNSSLGFIRLQVLPWTYQPTVTPPLGLLAYSYSSLGFTYILGCSDHR